MARRLPGAAWIAALITAVWWPIESSWLSDDWIAVHHAADPMRALGDFAGNQYGLPGLVWFYRPLITLGFVVDGWFGGTPFVSHLSNAIALGLGAVGVGWLASRFLGPHVGWCAALIWGTSPVHAASVCWAVGRVDSHTTVWILLSAVLVVRWCDGDARTRWPALVAATLALASKELAIVIPAIAALLCAGLAEPGQRVRRAVSGSWPFFVLVAAYFALRYALFGRFLGGYPHYALTTDQVTGVVTFGLRTINPWWDRGGPTLVAWLAFAPAILGLGSLVRARRFGLLLALLSWFVLCAVPAAQFWGRLENPRNLRYFTLAFAGLATVVAAGRWWTTAIALALSAIPLIEIRGDYVATHADCRAIHRRLVERADALPGNRPILVAGLPVQNEANTVIAFHFGVDRLLAEPFGPGRHRLFALRPLDRLARAMVLPDPAGPIPPDAEAWRVSPTAIADLPRRAGEPPASGTLDLETMDVDFAGAIRLTPGALRRLHRGEIAPAFVTAPRTPHYRITIFTAGGYLTCVLPDESVDEEERGRVSLKSWLVSGHDNPARTGSVIALGMRVPTALDLATDFPVWIEGGAVGPQGFRPTHAADRLLWVEFDREYVAFMDPNSSR